MSKIDFCWHLSDRFVITLRKFEMDDEMHLYFCSSEICTELDQTCAFCKEQYCDRNIATCISCKKKVCLWGGDECGYRCCCSLGQRARGVRCHQTVCADCVIECTSWAEHHCRYCIGKCTGMLDKPVASIMKWLGGDQKNETALKSDIISSCVSCHDATAARALVPCGHRCLCSECAGKLFLGVGKQYCPVCQAPTTDAIYVLSC